MLTLDKATRIADYLNAHAPNRKTVRYEPLASIAVHGGYHVMTRGQPSRLAVHVDGTIFPRAITKGQTP